MPREASWANRLRQAAETHNLLASDIKEFLRTPPYEIAVDQDPQENETVVWLHPTRATDPRWSLRISEVLHHLRAALDNAVWQLSSAPLAGVTSFPIASSAGAWVETKKRAATVPELARIIIEDAQPFRSESAGLDPAFHPLCLLRDLSNVDKHRELHTTAVATRIPALELETQAGVVARGPSLPGVAYAGDVELVRAGVSGVASGEVKIAGTINAGVCFDVSVRKEVPAVECHEVVAVLGAIGEEVISLVRR